METLCFDVDELAPEVIDKVKYVLHGDFSQLQEMKTQSQEWAQKVRSASSITVECVVLEKLGNLYLFCFLFGYKNVTWTH